MTSDLHQIPLTDRNVYDEMSGDGITLRPHWEHLLTDLQELGTEELGRRWDRAERRIRENGVTYNIYGDPRGVSRPWDLDLLPLLIPSEEWRHIEAGIIQRAELLNRLLEDLYGPQELLSSGRIPAELVFANPAFLRPLAGVKLRPRSHLHLVAIDLARSSDGEWWVISQRAQTPSGAGYALENRTIISEVLPELFRSSNVMRLAPFFRAYRNSLIRLAQRDDPRVVLLTPGVYNETYFEHSYLARYLGFTLVEGGDLTVRDRRVYMKAVHGMQQVDVIKRRVDDSFCDPLELRPDSYLGVAGLVDAIDAGNVSVANALGSGLIETSAILPFLPGLSRHLLGERLKMPSVATWWCGQDYALDWVMDHLDQVVIKPAFPVRGGEPVFGAELDSRERETFLQQLRSRAYEYVAQERVALSTAPVWDRGKLLSRSIVLRTYVVNNGDGWTAMPGGLVRVAESDGPVVSMQRGGHSKDAWVLSDLPADSYTLLPSRAEPVQLRRGSRDLPSRVADNLFWLGRYIERSENIARLLRTLLPRVRQTNETEFRCLLRLYSCLETSRGKLPKKRRPTPLELEGEIISLMTDRDRPDSLATTLEEVSRVGRAVRERLSEDMIRLLGQLTECVHVDDYMLFVEYSAVLTGCLELLAAVSGMERENITRGPGWLFLNMGKRLERAMYSVRQMREIAETLQEPDYPLLEYVLEAVDSSITYRTRYYTTLQPVAVLDVLMLDETNPRSLAFQLIELSALYAALPRHSSEDLRTIRSMVEYLETCNPGADMSGNGSRLGSWLRELENRLPAWSNHLSERYFSHAYALPISVGE